MKNANKVVMGTLGVFALLILLYCVPKLTEDVQAGEIVVIQDPVDGELHVYTQPGMVSQNLGRVTHYKKSFQYWFDGNEKEDHSPLIPTKFYDGGHASIPGSARIDLPLDEISVIKFHTKFGSQEAIESQLIGQTLIKAVSMSGPLMSSKESYAEKKNNLVYYIEDQAAGGIYKTTQKDIKVIDQLTNAEKIVTAVEIINNNKGQPMRQEKSLLKDLNITLSNLSLGDFVYDDVVKKQIATQQMSTMQVQTGIANAKRAEQDAITVEQQGKADAAKARWEQEVIKARTVTEAEQRKAVASLDVQTAELNKRKSILEGEGEAAKKRLVMQANGALEQKLQAWLQERQYAWEAFSKYEGNMVPSMIMGSGAGNSYNASDWMSMMGMKAAKDLSLDLKNTK